MWEIILLPFEENGHQLQHQQQKKQPSRQQEPLRPSSNYASSTTTATTTFSTPSFGSTHRNARDTTIHDTFEETSTKANELNGITEQGTIFMKSSSYVQVLNQA